MIHPLFSHLSTTYGRLKQKIPVSPHLLYHPFYYLWQIETLPLEYPWRELLELSTTYGRLKQIDDRDIGGPV